MGGANFLLLSLYRASSMASHPSVFWPTLNPASIISTASPDDSARWPWLTLALRCAAAAHLRVMISIALAIAGGTVGSGNHESPLHSALPPCRGMCSFPPRSPRRTARPGAATPPPPPPLGWWWNWNELNHNTMNMTHPPTRPPRTDGPARVRNASRISARSHRVPRSRIVKIESVATPPAPLDDRSVRRMHKFKCFHSLGI